MKKLSTLLLTALLSAAFVAPVSARTCPKLIKEGRDLLAKSQLAKAEKDKAKLLIDDSEKAHDSGDHNEAMRKIREALALLKPAKAAAPAASLAKSR